MLNHFCTLLWHSKHSTVLIHFQPVMHLLLTQSSRAHKQCLAQPEMALSDSFSEIILRNYIRYTHMNGRQSSDSMVMLPDVGCLKAECDPKRTQLNCLACCVCCVADIKKYW